MRRTFLFYGHFIRIIPRSANPPSDLVDIMEYFEEVAEAKHRTMDPEEVRALLTNFTASSSYPFTRILPNSE